MTQTDEINENRPQVHTNIDQIYVMGRQDSQQKLVKESSKQDNSQVHHHFFTKEWILRAFANHYINAVSTVEIHQNKKESTYKVDQQKVQERQS